MTIVIILAALVLGVVLMKETGWADLTGNQRNNLVFEKRNKAYGAFEIRRKYGNRLVFAFLCTMCILTMAAFAPRFLHQSATNTQTEKPNPKTETRIFDNEKKVEKEEPPLEKKEQPKKQDVSTVAKTPPAPSEIPQIDTTKTPDNAIVSNITHTGTDTSTLIDPRIPIGKSEGNCIDCKTTPPPPVEIRTQGEVTKQAEFDYQNYFRKNLRIPDHVTDLGLANGKVYVSFVVDEEGNVTNVNIKRGMVAELDNEIKRVTAGMPKWKPAQFNNNNVKVRMIIPISISFR